jgi:MYXO-CTERM domain-containing protein
MKRLCLIAVLAVSFWPSAMNHPALAQNAGGAAEPRERAATDAQTDQTRGQYGWLGLLGLIGLAGLARQTRAHTHA